MSSRHEVSRRRERSRSRSVERHRSRKDHKARSRSRSPAPSKHRSPSREKSKHKKSKKKKKKKKRSSSSSSSSDTDEELRLLQRLEAERLRLKEERKKQKESQKANETPEEKRARRLKEKQEKERKRRERMGWDNEYQCYTNQDNPFGDSALTHSFVWTKKLAKEGVKAVSRDELDAMNRQKQLENKIELEKVKQRRLEREAERAAREAETAAAARAREAAQFDSWARQEDAFHLQQARLRSQIRIRDGRAKPIDLLAWYVGSEQCVDALEMHEPYTYLNGLQAPDLEDLLADIAVYKSLEHEQNQRYWKDVETIVQDELAKLRRAAPEPHEAVHRDTVHQSVAEDVTQIFKGKTGAQLEALQSQIEQKISARADNIDVGYWESLLSQLKAHMARARLRDRHQNNLRRKLQLLKQEQGVAAKPEPESRPDENPQPTGSTSPKAQARTEAPPEAEAEASGSGSGGESEPDSESEAACIALYRAGRYSPAPLSPRVLEPGTLTTDADIDEQRLQYLRTRAHAANAQRAHEHCAPAGGGGGCGRRRRRVRAGGTTRHGHRRGAVQRGGRSRQVLSHSETRRVARRYPSAAIVLCKRASVEAICASDLPRARHDYIGLVTSEALPVPALWPDKYRPRKPRYFNRVHTGFEWNKYNQTHYDMDNPPPKIVQGYKFNIFYPDLIDPKATPDFSLKPCADNPEFAVLRFRAGPPYEDIAFKIVNREWEYSYKRGFRCHFHNNIFQLWFHFKRYRYRR
ncbi:cactin [Leguminivora glycinivorella]|uniref:cactin n=1 Tax=Leguminivora glycinivorella TaxID=1035111 RepID=UPI00200FB387|nr:cactin [Leguminivora glycinivorella]